MCSCKYERMAAKQGIVIESIERKAISIFVISDIIGNTKTSNNLQIKFWFAAPGQSLDSRHMLTIAYQPQYNVRLNWYDSSVVKRWQIYINELQQIWKGFVRTQTCESKILLHEKTNVQLSSLELGYKLSRSHRVGKPRRTTEKYDWLVLGLNQTRSFALLFSYTCKNKKDSGTFLDAQKAFLKKVGLFR